MKIFEIADEQTGEQMGVLLYYEKTGSFIVELQEWLDEWTAPLLFTGLVKKHIYTVPKDISAMWVQERLIPSGRQNIGSILSASKLKEYDEMKILEISKGRCSQDSLFIRKLEGIPDYVSRRMNKNLRECAVLQDGALICFFQDNTTKKISLSELRNSADLRHDAELADHLDKILKNQNLMQSGKVGIGGYTINFGENIDIPSGILYQSGITLPLKLEDFLTFIRSNILDTADTCNILQCSRQNLSYLQGKQLAPVKENVKGTLYLKGDIEKIRW